MRQDIRGEGLEQTDLNPDLQTSFALPKTPDAASCDGLVSRATAFDTGPAIQEPSLDLDADGSGPCESRHPPDPRGAEDGSSYETESEAPAPALLVAESEGLVSQVEEKPRSSDSCDAASAISAMPAAQAITQIADSPVSVPEEQPADAVDESEYTYETESEAPEAELLASDEHADVAELPTRVVHLDASDDAKVQEPRGQHAAKHMHENPSSRCGPSGSRRQDMRSECQGGGLNVQSKLAHTLAAAFQERQRAIGQPASFNVASTRHLQQADDVAKEAPVRQIILLE